MGNFQNDYRRLTRILAIVEDYNRIRNMGAKEDLKEIRTRLESLEKITDNEKLTADFIWCTKMLDSYFGLIEKGFKEWWEEQRQKEFT